VITTPSILNPKFKKIFLSIGAAQVVTESRSEMSQFQYLEQKSQVRQEVMEEHTTQAPVFTSSMKSVELKEGQVPMS
jgi:hypothetical protein